MRATSDAASAAAHDMEKPLLESLSEGLQLQHAPLLNVCRSTAADKLRIVMHGIWLEAGGSASSMQQYCESIVACTTDMGTEYLLSSFEPCTLRQLFPWLGLPQDTPTCCVDDIDMVEEGAGDESSGLLGLSNSLGVPGLLHILHRATGDMLHVVPVLNEAVGVLTKVASFLQSRDSKERLIATCFGSGVAKEFAADIKRFTCKVNRERWGTICFAVDDLLRLQRPLRRFWDLKRYTCAGMHHTGTAPSAEMVAIDEALDDDMFWSSLETMRALFSCVCEAFHWAEGCPCHSHLNFDGAPADVRQLWESCPLRGARLPEVSSGDFLRHVEAYSVKAAATLVLALPTSLTREN
eukprot:6474145-Amphidinium_carterae.1